MPEPDFATNPTQEAGLAAWDAGLSVCPPKVDGSKAPAGFWKSLQRVRNDRAWAGTATALGVGTLMGSVFRPGSRDEHAEHKVECLEFDDAAIRDAFLAGVAPLPTTRALVERVRAGYEEGTPGGGTHWLYYCAEVGGNAKLAQRPKTPEEQRHPNDTTKTLIETRGEGGYVVNAPTNGKVHPTGGAYVRTRGGFGSIATITPSERRALFEAARTFDVPLPGAEPRADEPAKERRAGTEGKTPGNDYDESADWGDILGPHGWSLVKTDGRVGFWRRPGAQTDNHDATTNHGGDDKLYVFSSSCAPFQHMRAYRKFAVHALLNHGGDFKAAAADLRAKGYGVGDGPELRESAKPGGEFSLRDLMRREIVPVRHHLRDLLTAGTYVLSGKPKIGKSWLVGHLSYAVATGGEFLGQRVEEPGDVLLLALEDNAGRLRSRFAKLIWADVAPMTGGRDQPIDLEPADRPPEALDIRLDCAALDPDPEKGLLAVIEEWRSRHPGARLIVIDVLQRIKPPSAKGKGAHEQDYEAVAAIQRYVSQHEGVTCLIVHHNRKMESADPLDLVSGTLGLVGGVDGLWILRRVRGKADAAMYVTGRDIEDDRDLALRFDKQTVRWELLGNVADVARSREQAEIIDALRESRNPDGTSKPLTPTEIAEATELKVGTVKARLRVALKQGTVTVGDGGRYSLLQADPVRDGGRHAA